ncbi:ATP-binding cassette domain-containing protein [Actinomycetaceae bacterium L2_0104]
MTTSSDNLAPMTVRHGQRAWTVQPGDKLLIGRSGECHINIADPRISRRHIELTVIDGLWMVQCLGSNGAFADGQRLPQAISITGPLTIRLSDPADGPAVTFAVEDEPTLSFGMASQAAPSAFSGAVPPAAPAQPASASTPPPPAAYPVPTPNGQQFTPAPPPMSAPSAPQPASAPPPAPSNSGVFQLSVQIPTRIGRASDNELKITDLQASRYHARLQPTPQGFVLEDLGSMNGTQLNGINVSHALLTPGDIVTIGATRFRFSGSELLPATSAPGSQSLVASGVSFALASGKVLLEDVNLVIPPSALVAVIGPSGAGKSTLLGALTGTLPLANGSVHFDHRDMHRDHAEMRQRVGLVPQEDVVHRLLTLRKALEYAAELRFPHDLGKEARSARVMEVIDELGLRDHAETRIDRLSGGQRKRASVALELLTRPSLLFLDEPTSGLDPGLDKQVMDTLRTLADGGRTVVVVTHSVDNLNVCDAVLLLAPGGRVAYYGPPSELLPYFNQTSYADVFVNVAADPLRFQHAFAGSQRGAQERQRVTNTQASIPAQTLTVAPERTQRRSRELSTLLRRQTRMMLADKGYSISMLVLPAVLALLAMIVPGESGLGAVPGGSQIPNAEPRQLLLLLVVGAVFMGMAASVRDLIGERPIFKREHSVGLSVGTYLSSKLFIYAVVVCLQSVILVLLMTAGKTGPPSSSLLGSGTLELIVACALAAFASACIGLVLSALVSSAEQVMPALVIGIMTQLVLSGGLFPVVGRAVLEQVSWLAPSRWGFSAMASTADLSGISLIAPDGMDAMWEQNAGAWMISILLLVVLSAFYAGVCYFCLRRRHR